MWHGDLPKKNVHWASKATSLSSLSFQESIKIMVVEVSRGLGFDRHVKYIAKKVSYRVFCLRRVAGFLKRRGKLMVYDNNSNTKKIISPRDISKITDQK